jgi:hypothetical protein
MFSLFFFVFVSHQHFLILGDHASRASAGVVLEVDPLASTFIHEVSLIG